MTTLTEPVPATAHAQGGWFSKTEAWLDDKGKGAWIAAMVLGFVFFWPVGLALLFYMIWSKRMCSKSFTGKRSWAKSGMSAMRPTGNSAFDSYKADTLRRLEQEQHDFEAFLERLREAKDKSEFDDFMNERADRTTRSEADDSAERA